MVPRNLCQMLIQLPCDEVLLLSQRQLDLLWNSATLGLIGSSSRANTWVRRAPSWCRHSFACCVCWRDSACLIALFAYLLLLGYASSIPWLRRQFSNLDLMGPRGVRFNLGAHLHGIRALRPGSVRSHLVHFSSHYENVSVPLYAPKEYVMKELRVRGYLERHKSKLYPCKRRGEYRSSSPVSDFSVIQSPSYITIVLAQLSSFHAHGFPQTVQKYTK